EQRARPAHLELVPGGDVQPGHHERARGRAEAAALAAGALVVRAIAREQHAHVHLVRAPLEPLEPALEPAHRPLAVALPEHLRRRVGDGRAGHLRRDRVAAPGPRELAALPRGRRAAPGPDRALGERAAMTGDDLVPVDADGATEAAAHGAGADRRLVREQA